MKLTAGQAAKETGKSIPTITRAIGSGRLSADRTDDGKGYLIDPAELFRVFPPLTRETNETPPVLGDETPNETRPLEVEVAVLREKLALLETYSAREREQLSGQIEDLRADLERWRSQAERATKLIAPPAETPIPAPPVTAERGSWLSRWWTARKS